jgi:hypothetical protein
MFPPETKDCDKECRFQQNGPSSRTLAYYNPIYDKHGNDLNPDGNTTFGGIKCTTCGKEWQYAIQYGKTEWTKVEREAPKVNA